MNFVEHHTVYLITAFLVVLFGSLTIAYLQHKVGL